jgi:hypothetical protein
VIAKAEALDKQIFDHGLRHPAWGKAQAGEQLTAAERRIVNRGGLWTGKEAQEAIRNLKADTGEEYVAVRAYPGKLDAETQRIIREDLQGPGGMESLSQRLLNDRHVVDLTNTRTRNIVLMPKAYIDRVHAHLAPAGGLERFFQMLNPLFRLSVLPQLRWLTGNFVEPYIVRLTAAGSGLNVFGLANDIRAANRTLAAMERSGNPRIAAAAREIRAQQTGSGLFIGGGERQSIHRRLEDVFPSSYGRVVSRLPVVGQMADMIGTAGHWLVAPLRAFFHVNRLIETGAQRAAFGREARKSIQEFTGSWTQTVRLGDKAVQEAARGLVDTPTQRRFMREQEILLGKYAAFSPAMRWLVQGPAPFLPWALNAARFAFWTMPTRHTALTSLLIKTNDVVADDWAKRHANVPPGALKLAISKAGGWVDVARYTPWGLTGPIVEGELGGITQQWTPQLRGAVGAIEGKDPFGRDLVVKPTSANPRGTPTVGQKIGIGAYGFAEAMVPYLSWIRRLREGGGTPYAGSTAFAPSVKPGSSHMPAWRRTFDPFRPTYLRAPTGQAGQVVKTGGGPKMSPQDRILMKAAERATRGGLNDRQLEILERAAMRGVR